MASILTIVNEPTGATYRSILRLASDVCASFSLVWSDQLEFGSSAHQVAEALRPLLIREARTVEWPGMRLLGHQATIRHYRLNADAIRVLGRAWRLYGWRAPDFPEDLAFYTIDGAVWLGSIARERCAWIENGPNVETKVRTHVPGLEVVKRDQDK